MKTNDELCTSTGLATHQNQAALFLDALACLLGELFRLDARQAPVDWAERKKNQNFKLIYLKNFSAKE